MAEKKTGKNNKPTKKTTEKKIVEEIVEEIVEDVTPVVEETIIEETPIVEEVEEIVEDVTPVVEEEVEEVEEIVEEAPVAKTLSVKDNFAKEISKTPFRVYQNGVLVCTYNIHLDIKIMDKYFEINNKKYSYNGIEIKHA